MRLPLLKLPVVNQSDSWGPAWIGIGLGVLVAGAWLSAVPVVTAMALVALGATTVTVDRFRGRSRADLVVVLNLLVYCSLYALFFGTMLHQARAGATRQLGPLAAMDLVASAWPLALVVVKSWHALRHFEPAG
ncbi:MAG TPA: hypothetical protein VGM76_00610 [Lacipirellulaceae bacterium]